MEEKLSGDHRMVERLIRKIFVKLEFRWRKLKCPTRERDYTTLKYSNHIKTLV